METDLFIAGTWQPASSGGRFDVLDPATGDVIASVADGGGAEPTIEVAGASKSAIEKIEKAGGSVKLLAAAAAAE